MAGGNGPRAGSGCDLIIATTATATGHKHSLHVQKTKYVEVQCI